LYVCICHRVPEREVQNCIHAGARSEDAVGEACEAGTGCGTCLERISEMLEAYYGQPAAALAG
jgi:bacterioferritin-associated ferredoxin